MALLCCFLLLVVAFFLARFSFRVGVQSAMCLAREEGESAFVEETAKLSLAKIFWKINLQHLRKYTPPTLEKTPCQELREAFFPPLHPEEASRALLGSMEAILFFSVLLLPDTGFYTSIGVSLFSRILLLCGFSLLLAAALTDAMTTLVPDLPVLAGCFLIFLGKYFGGIPDAFFLYSCILAAIFIVMGFFGYPWGDVKFLAAFAICGGLTWTISMLIVTFLFKLFLDRKEGPLMPWLFAAMVLTCPSIWLFQHFCEQLSAAGIF